MNQNKHVIHLLSLSGCYLLYPCCVLARAPVTRAVDVARRPLGSRADPARVEARKNLRRAAGTTNELLRRRNAPTRAEFRGRLFPPGIRLPTTVVGIAQEPMRCWTCPDF